MEDWFVVAVEPRAEAAVSSRAEQLDISAYFPLSRKLVRSRRRRRGPELEAKALPAMPGYVFVQGELRFAQFGRDCDAPDAVPHCLGWLNGSDGPAAVPGPVIAEIQQREADGEFDSAERAGRYWAPRWLRPGARVRITAGAFAGLMGDVWRMTAQRRVSVWVQMMGAPTLTECPLEWVARSR